MDIPPRSINNDIQRNIQKEYSNDNSNHGDILQPTWVCGIIRPGRILDWFLSNNRWYFLCRVNLFIYPLLFIIKKMGL
jgi:hypothetical protein